MAPEPVCANKARNGPASADKTISLAAKGVLMCTAPWAETCPPPSILHFSLAQTYLQKQIVPTDNMWLKSNGVIGGK